jgi:N-acetylglutamate synthase-like GNAT family acetyltransferase
LDIRPFGGTRQDAQGIIEVDRETFGDCTYAAEYILSLLSNPCQRAWVAVEDSQVIGFVSCFPTSSLAADRWEVDELAVRPAYQGRGIGTRLVARAMQAESAPGTEEARALVAKHNIASQRAFEKNGFAAIKDVDLLLYQVSGRVPRPTGPGLPAVRPARDEDMPAIAALAGKPASEVADLIRRADNTYLVAMHEERVIGIGELLHVHTLQYEGLWLESLCIPAADRQTAKALFGRAIEEAKHFETVDRVGYLVAPEDRIRYDACVSEGFARIDAYSVYVRRIGWR